MPQWNLVWCKMVQLMIGSKKLEESSRGFWIISSLHRNPARLTYMWNGYVCHLSRAWKWWKSFLASIGTVAFNREWSQRVHTLGWLYKCRVTGSGAFFSICPRTWWICFIEETCRLRVLVPRWCGAAHDLLVFGAFVPTAALNKAKLLLCVSQRICPAKLRGKLIKLTKRRRQASGFQYCDFIGCYLYVFGQTPEFNPAVWVWTMLTNCLRRTAGSKSLLLPCTEVLKASLLSVKWANSLICFGITVNAGSQTQQTARCKSDQTSEVTVTFWGLKSMLRVYVFIQVYYSTGELRL